MYAMSYTVANAVRCALSCNAWQPERVLAFAVRVAPELDNVALVMIQKYLEQDEWNFGGVANRRAAYPHARRLLTAVKREILLRKTYEVAD